MLDFDLFTRVIDEAGPSLGRIDFFNYGEAFLHKRAVEMCEYIKANFPHIYLYTSTNGLAFTEERCQPARPLGHRRGHLLDRRRDARQLRPVPAARRLRQGDREPHSGGGREARSRARRAVHQLALHPVQLERQRRGDGARPQRWPPTSASIASAGRSRIIRERVSRAASRPARPASMRIKSRGLGRQRPRQRDSRGDAPRRASTCARRCPGCRWSPARAARCSCAPACGTSPARFPAKASYGRRLVRLGAQLCAADGTLIDRDYARAWLPAHVEAGGEADVASRSRRPTRRDATVLKFDLVSEGIDWFELADRRPRRSRSGCR